MVSRHRVDRDELAAHIEANNRAANLLRASFNDPSIRTFSSGFTGGPSAPPQTPQPRRPSTMCFTRFGAQRDPPPPPQQQQQTTGYRAAPRRESVSAPRHDFHDRDCGDRPRRDALPDVWYDDFWHDPGSAPRHSRFLETAMEADGQRTIKDESIEWNFRVSGSPDEESVQTPAEPTPTWGSSKTFLEATVDEAMDQGKYKATLESIWPKTRDWAADGDETYANTVCQLAVSKWAKLSVMKVKVKLDAIRDGTYREMSLKAEKQFSCAYTDWWTTIRLHKRLVTESEFKVVRDSGLIKQLTKEEKGMPPLDQRFRDYLQENEPAPAQPSSSTAPPPPVPAHLQRPEVSKGEKKAETHAAEALSSHAPTGAVPQKAPTGAPPPASLVPIPSRGYNGGAAVRPTQQTQTQAQPVLRNMAWPRDPASQVEASVPKLQQMLDLIQAAGLGITMRHGWQPFVMQIPINRSASSCWASQRLIIEANDLLQNKGIKFAWNSAFQLTFRSDTREVGIEETAYLAYLWRFVVMPYHEHLRSHGNKPLAEFVNAKLRQLGPEHYRANTNAALVGIATAIQRRDVRTVAVEASAFTLPSSSRGASQHQSFPSNGRRGRRGRRGGSGRSV
ncbi:hypothetical protein CGCSCA1_v014406 [Colletotrichum siamense]|nr:hypothetical protein CGCSCA1_v014406 [Colletotrichum siamense]